MDPIGIVKTLRTVPNKEKVYTYIYVHIYTHMYMYMYIYAYLYMAVCRFLETKAHRQTITDRTLNSLPFDAADMSAA